MFKVNKKHQSDINCCLSTTTGTFIVNFERIFRFVIVFFLITMTLNM